MKNVSHTNDKKRSPSITIERLEQLLDAYGADPERWPPAEREAALSLLERSAEARARRDAAASLDALLDLVPAERPPAELAARVMEAARSQLQPPPNRRRAWPYLAAAVPLAAAAALALWIARSPEQPIGEATPEMIALLGVYETPTDELLDPPIFDLFNAVPSLGCPDSELACPDLEPAQQPESMSHSHSRRKTQA